MEPSKSNGDNDLGIRFRITRKAATQGNRRALTQEEKAYIHKANWLRLLRWLDYTIPVLLLPIGLGILVFFLGHVLVQETHGGTVAIMLSYIVPILVTAAIFYGIRKKLPLGSKIWLRTKKLEAIALTGHLGVQIDPGEHHYKVHSLDNTRFGIPRHWQGYMHHMVQKEEFPLLSLWVVQRKDASDTAYSNRYHLRYSSIVRLSRFEDFQYQALGCGSLSVHEDIKNNIPMIRAHDLWMACSVILAMMTLFIGIYLTSARDDMVSERNKLAWELKEKEKQLQLAGPQSTNLWVGRGLPVLEHHASYGNNIVVNKTPFTHVNVSLGRKGAPFLLTPEEHHIIQALTQVTPRVLLGSAPDNGKILKDYRKAISQRLMGISDIGDRTLQWAKQALAAIPDDVLELQIRSYGNRFRVHPSFAAYFLPQPMVFLPLDNHRIQRKCGDRSLFCVADQGNEGLKMEEMALIPHGAEKSEYRLIPKKNIDRLVALKQQLQSPSQSDPKLFWTRGKGSIIWGMGSFALVLFVSWWSANARINQVYKKKFAFN